MAGAVIERLLDELEANRSMFVALCLAVEDAFAEPAPGGSWSVGDHVAHIASYDQWALHHLRPALAPLEPRPQLDGDDWNDREVRQRRGRTRAALVGEMAERRAGCLGLLLELPPRGLKRAVWFPGEARRSAGEVPLRLWLERWSKHDMIHAREIVRATPSLGARGDFEDWLRDDPVLDAIARTDRGARTGGVGGA